MSAPRELAAIYSKAAAEVAQAHAAAAAIPGLQVIVILCEPVEDETGEHIALGAAGFTSQRALDPGEIVEVLAMAAHGYERGLS